MDTGFHEQNNTKINHSRIANNVKPKWKLALHIWYKIDQAGVNFYTDKQQQNRENVYQT